MYEETCFDRAIAKGEDLRDNPINKGNNMEESNIEKAKRKIENILRKYNMRILSQDEWHSVLIQDNSTKEYKEIN